MREVLTDYDTELIQKADYRGIRKLRRAIADYLYRSRGMNVDEECVVIGQELNIYSEGYIRFSQKIPYMPWKIQDIKESGIFMRIIL